MRSQLIRQTSRPHSCCRQTGAPRVVPPGPLIHPQTTREGPGYVTNVSGTRTGLDDLQYNRPSSGPAPPSAPHFPSFPKLCPTGWSTLITLSHTRVYLNPTSMVPIELSPVRQPRLSESEETLPRSFLNTPIEASQGLVTAATEAAAAPSISASRFVRYNS